MEWYASQIKIQNDAMFDAGINPQDLDQLLWPKNPGSPTSLEAAAAAIANKFGIARCARKPIVIDPIHRKIVKQADFDAACQARRRRREREAERKNRLRRLQRSQRKSLAHI